MRSPSQLCTTITALFLPTIVTRAFLLSSSPSSTKKHGRPIDTCLTAHRDPMSNCDRRHWLMDAISVTALLTTTTATTATTATTSLATSAFALDTSSNDAAAAAPAAAAAAVGGVADKYSNPTITDQIFLEIKTPSNPNSQRIKIGLYGKMAPKSTQMLLQLVSSTGLASKCKPRDTSKVLEKEQLEANQVFNSCMENESKGVNYDYSTIWRIVQDERIDLGAVSGKFVAREYPNWDEEIYNHNNNNNNDNNNNAAESLKSIPPMEFGSVFVERGNQSGFGFSIYPGKQVKATADDIIVVGRVLEGLDVIEQWNNFPVVKSSKLNYMALTGSDGMRKAPSRACRYGSTNLYCNEFKPLQKLSIVDYGVVR